MYKKIIRLWLQMSDKIRFAIVGCFNALIAYMIYVFFILIFGKYYYQHSLALAWIFSSIISFFTHRIFVFRGKGNLIKEYIKCASTWIVAYFINAFLLEILVKFIKLNPYLAQVIAPAIAGIFTFIMFKKMAFKRK